MKDTTDGSRRLLLGRALFLALLLGCGEDPADPSVPARVTVSPATVTLTAIDDTQQLTAEVRDQYDGIMTGVAVGWSSQAPATVTVQAGTGLVAAVSSGSATIVATVGSVRGEAVVTVEQVAATVDKAGGDEQVGFPGTVLAEPVTVRVLDANGHPAGGLEVAFEVTSGEGSVSPATVSTEPDGVAKARWTLGSDSIQTLTAAAGELAVTFRATRRPLHGFMRVQLTTPDSTANAGAMLAIVGPNLDSLRSSDYELFTGGPATDSRVIVAGNVQGGTLLEFRIPDVREASNYVIKLLQIAAEGYGQRDLDGYTLEVEVHEGGPGRFPAHVRASTDSRRPEGRRRAGRGEACCPPHEGRGHQGR